MATKYSAKLQLASSMNSSAMASSSGESKYAKLASCEDSPPRLTVVNMCISASMGAMPAAQKARPQAMENTAYTPHRPLAVSVMRGVSLVSLIGPAASARNSWLPPTPSSGSTATARIRIPMPPSHCRKVRQTLIDCGRSSSPTSTVAPEVVRPETASK